MQDSRIIQQGLPALVIEHYPDSDGLPMAESDRHYRAIQSVRVPLESRYRDHHDVYVTGDLLLYYQRYDTSKSLAPDVMVVLGTSPHERLSYRVWEEGRPPDVVVEVSSRTSVQRDREEKLRIYGEMGVREYFLYVPDYGETARCGRMWAFRRWGEGLVEVEADPESAVGGEPEHASELLGVGFRAEGNRVRVRDLETGLDLEWFEEVEEGRKADARARRIAEQEREQAEREREQERQAREAEAKARRIAEQEREQERRARRLVEEHLARLQARLRDEE